MLPQTFHIEFPWNWWIFKLQTILIIRRIKIRYDEINVNCTILFIIALRFGQLKPRIVCSGNNYTRGLPHGLYPSSCAATEGIHHATRHSHSYGLAWCYALMESGYANSSFFDCIMKDLIFHVMYSLPRVYFKCTVFVHTGLIVRSRMEKLEKTDFFFQDFEFIVILFSESVARSKTSEHVESISLKIICTGNPTITFF